MVNPAEETRISDGGEAQIDMRIEVVVIPISNVERAKEFYVKLGWRLDADVTSGRSRLIQITPPGSDCSVQFGENLFGIGVPAAASGSAQSLYLIVSDIVAARNELIALGVEVSEAFHCSEGFSCRFPGNDGRVAGPSPERSSYGSFASFCDPDGNRWLLQEITTRLPGRVTGGTTFGSADDLSQALRRAATAHEQHEARIGRTDADWPDWYASYLLREQTGAERPQ